MANRKSIHAVERSNRQWAWQFLRRNQGYRQAYTFLGALSDGQRDIFLKLIQNQIGLYSEIWSELGLLPVKLFDKQFLWGVKEEHETLDDFIRSEFRPFSTAKKSAQYIAQEIDNLVLRVAPEYRAGSYGLFHWVDPAIESMTPEEADSIWFYSVPLESSLTRTPWLDDKGFSFEKSVAVGATIGNQHGAASEAVEPKENRNRPVQAEMLPLKKGINGAVFEINNFSSPASYHPVDGQRIPIGSDPVPLSLDGDTLVRATFDVGLPIEYQLETVKAYLIAHQQELQQAGFIDALPSRKGRQGVFESYIQILDLHEQGVSDLDIAIKLKNLESDIYIDAQGKKNKNFIDPKNPDWATAQEHTNVIRKQLERARYLRDYGYRSLALQWVD
ncbi:MAG: hypothetical protein RL211_1348 [Pseudomonadota bacterium]|jgi:hypothetical protein